MARFNLDVHVANLIAAQLEAHGHDVQRVGHEVDDAEVVASCLERNAILVTFNRDQYMAQLIEEGLPRGLRVFSLESMNQLRRQTRRRLSREMAAAILRLCATPGAFYCSITLTESRHRLQEPVFKFGGPASE